MGAGQQFSKFLSVTTVGANEVVAVPFFTRGDLRRMIIRKSDAGAFNATAYCRAFTSAAKNITSIENDGNGKCRIIFAVNHKMQVGDSITVAGNGVGGYNTTHVVTKVYEFMEGGRDHRKVVVTNQNYSADGAGGTGTLAIPATEQPCYEVVPLTAAVSGVVRINVESGYLFSNMDAPEIGDKPLGFIYIMLSAAGTYAILVAGNQLV